MGTGELSGLRDEMLDDLLTRPNLPLRESTEEVAVDLESELKKALQGSDWLCYT